MPPIALLTDFGIADPYVGVMKGVIAGIAPGVPVVDVTHGVPAQDIRVGALFLDASWPYFPEGTVFLCVVDPGVGTDRRAVVARAANRMFVGPDNGLFGLLPSPETREIGPGWGLATRSRTFDGRDLFAPVAARLAMGARYDTLGMQVSDPTPLTLPQAHEGVGTVLYVDGYGNAVTNLPGVEHGTVYVSGRAVPVGRAYADAAPEAALALTGSTGRLEIAVRGGSAATRLGISAGAPVRWEVS